MEKISVGLEWFLNPNHIPLIVGMKKGWFEEEKIIINMIKPEEHIDALGEIKAGNMDIAITEPLHLVEDRANEPSVIGFARFLKETGQIDKIIDPNVYWTNELIFNQNFKKAANPSF